MLALIATIFNHQNDQEMSNKPDNTTLQFYVWCSLILQLHEFEKALPMFTTKPKIQQARGRFRTELGRLHKVLKGSFTNAELEVMYEAATAFGQAMTCSVMDSQLTVETLDQLVETIKAKRTKAE
jgi:hypothetical protein